MSIWQMIICIVLAIVGLILAIYLWTLLVRALKAIDYLADVEEARLMIESKKSGIDVEIEGRGRQRTRTK